MSLASMGTIASCLMIVGIFYCIAVNVDYMLETLEETGGITVFYTEDVSEKKTEALKQQINNIEAYKKLLANSAASSIASSVTLPTQSLKMALTIVVTGPIVLAYPIVQKYFVQGITIGAVKG